MIRRVIAVLFIWVLTLPLAFSAVTAGSIHYVWTTGAAGNGGCFDPTATGFATDGSATSATGNSPVFHSASYTFVAGDVDAWLFVKAGTDTIPGFYKIASVAGGDATLTASVGSGTRYGTATNSGLIVTTAAGIATVAAPSSVTWGIDYNQQAASEISYTDLVIGVGTDTATSAGNPFDVGDIGNCYNVTGGTGFTVQRVVLNSVAVAVGSFVTTGGGAANLGTTASTGGLATMGGARGAGIQAAEAAAVAGNSILVKATATYSITASQTYSTNGTAGNPITYAGYTTTPGDNGMVTVQRSSGNLTLFSVTGAFRRFYNFIADGASTGTQTCWSVGGLHNVFTNCRAAGYTANGFMMASGSSYTTYSNCYATGGTSAATAAFNTGAVSIANVVYSGCVAAGNQCIGFLSQSTNANVRVYYLRCIAANNNNGAGTYYDGFKTSNGQSGYIGCVSYANSNGILIDTATTATAGDDLFIQNSIFVNNNLYGITSNTTNYTTSGKYQLWIDYNAFYNNTSGTRNNLAFGDHSLTISGDPFVDGPNLNFALDNTSGEGAALRGTGFPGTLQAGGTGYLDFGPLQHQDSGGSGGQKGYTYVAKHSRPNPDLYSLLHPVFTAGLGYPPPVLGIPTLMGLLVGIWIGHRKSKV